MVRPTLRASSKKEASVKRTLMSMVLIGLIITDTPTVEAGTSANCRGKVLNPITDVCWSCVFPIEIGGKIPLGGKGNLPNPDTGVKPICFCGKDITMRAGGDLELLGALAYSRSRASRGVLTHDGWREFG